jgi:alkylation response protein AidB-like acyl-CoA dehydrogenase
MSTYVSLDPGRSGPGPLARIASESFARTLEDAVPIAVALGAIATPPGEGQSRDLWEAMATLAAGDLGVARLVEPHLDALAILNQAGKKSSVVRSDDELWGVYAAEGGTEPLTAIRQASGWSLSGTKPWCSLASRLDRALVTAHLAEGGRALFAVDLGHEGVHVLADQWHARGLTEVVSTAVEFATVPAAPVGAPGWYLDRPGFEYGGIGVAACWFGGAVGIARTLFAAVAPEPGTLSAVHLGAIDIAIESGRRALLEAAELVDGSPNPRMAKILAKRVRGTVARVCEEVIWRAAHALGPAPLALDNEHAKRVADLQLYVRQHHAERDDESLGALVAQSGVAPW